MGRWELGNARVPVHGASASHSTHGEAAVGGSRLPARVNEELVQGGHRAASTTLSSWTQLAEGCCKGSLRYNSNSEDAAPSPDSNLSCACASALAGFGSPRAAYFDPEHHRSAAACPPQFGISLALFAAVACPHVRQPDGARGKDACSGTRRPVVTWHIKQPSAGAGPRHERERQAQPAKKKDSAMAYRLLRPYRQPTRPGTSGEVQPCPGWARFPAPLAAGWPRVTTNVLSRRRGLPASRPSPGARKSSMRGANIKSFELSLASAGVAVSRTGSKPTRKAFPRRFRSCACPAAAAFYGARARPPALARRRMKARVLGLNSGAWSLKALWSV